MKQQKTIWNKLHQPHLLEAEDNTKHPTWHKLKTLWTQIKQCEHSSSEQNELKTNWNLPNPFLKHSRQRQQLARPFFNLNNPEQPRTIWTT